MSRDLPSPGSLTMHELALACPSALPASSENSQFFLAANERRQNSSATPSTAAAGANDAQQQDRLDYAFELARALLLGNEEPGDLALNIQGDEHRARLSGGLNASGDIRGVAKHLACRLHDN